MLEDTNSLDGAHVLLLCCMCDAYVSLADPAQIQLQEGRGINFSLI